MVRTFDVYQETAKKTDQYPLETRLMALVLGLASEAGEVSGKLGKRLRGDEELQNDRVFEAMMIAELGDVLWYIAMIANALGVPMAEIATRNLEKLERRHEAGTIKGDGDGR